MPDIFKSNKEEVQIESKNKKVTSNPDNKEKEVSTHGLVGLEKGTQALMDLRKKIESHPLGDTIHKLSGHSHNPLSSFCYFPDHVKFINEDPGEKIVLLLRKHPITNLSWISIAILMLTVPFFFSIFTAGSSLPSDIEFVLSLIWYLITGSFAFEKFLGWFFNVNIITDERIIEVDFHNMFYREISDANVDQIQDVTVEIGGGLRTLINYGDVLIQTAAEIPKIELEAVPNPDKVAKVLRELRMEEEIEKLEGRVR